MSLFCRSRLLLSILCAFGSASRAEEPPYFLGSWRKATVLDCSGYPQITKEKCEAIAQMEQKAVFSFTATELIMQNGTEQERTPYTSTVLPDGRVEIRNPAINQTLIFFRQGAQLCAANDKGKPVCYAPVQPLADTRPARPE